MAVLGGGTAAAQESPSTADGRAPGGATALGGSPAPAPGAAGKARPKTTAQTEAGEPRAGASPAAADARPATTPHAAKAPGGVDRLDLGTATVTGDREQPKVMYIVPWKRADVGDLSGKPMNSLLDEALAPIDRDEFKREVAYYDAVRSDAPQNGAAKAAAQGEK